MKTLNAFLAILLPQLGPVLLAAPQLLQLIRGAFTRVGGTDEELDAILNENKKLIDRLGKPDVYRRVPPVAPPVDPPIDPPDTSGIAYWPKTQTTEPDRSKLKPDDGLFHSTTGELWTVWDPNIGTQPPQPPSWERVN